MNEMLRAAKAAKQKVGTLTTDQKNRALMEMARALTENTQEILAANARDMENAKDKISPVMAEGIAQVAQLPDPVGHLLDRYTRPDGLQINKVSVPVGVIAIIYESRPNVTSDAAALALKSGNVCILRGGKEAFYSACAIVDAL